MSGPKTKKEKAFALFDEGKTSSDDEIKALNLKGSTKYNYFAEWQKLKGIPASLSGGKSEATERIRPISELAMMLPQEVLDEGLGGDGSEAEVNVEEGTEQPTKEVKLSESQKGTDGKKPQAAVVPTQGIVVTSVEVSTKTYMLYQITAAKNESKVTFGDFVDACVEDAFQGRGLDLGFITIGGKDTNG